MIKEFQGQYRFLSNFWPCAIEYNGYTYQSTEAAYQAQKYPGREIEFINLNPMEAKKLGKAKPRSDWHDVSLQIMEDLLRLKFKPNSLLGNKLIETGNEELIEGNWWGDTFWGQCKGIGENHLGKLLMKIRSEINWLT
jgi:ribA/ribD-fused uncharacterized protein